MDCKRFGLTAAHLRILALLLMLLDHLWATVIPGSLWMTAVGRLAFPIFAFQAAEGYRHTHDFRAYCKRLLVFGLISEIPYNFLVFDSPIFPFQQNVMFTLLLGILACKFWDEKKFWKLVLVILLGAVGFVDYGYLGVVTVLAFHVFRGSRWLQLAALVLIHGFGYGGLTISPFGFDMPLQALAIFAWLPLQLYNGEKGPGGKALQQISYWFYPVHMLILGLL